jgi:hypothetical protein
MNTQNTFTGTIGARIDSEIHPAGIPSPHSPNSNLVSMKLNNIYASLDYLCITGFGIDISQLTIITSNPGLQMIISDAKAQNPNIKLFATLACTDAILPDLLAIIDNPNTTQAFAGNIASYLYENNFDGFDIDWGRPFSSLTTGQCAALIDALSTAFDNNTLISISPSTTQGLDPSSINNNCSIINLQNYIANDVPDFPTGFAEYGISPTLLGFGARFETSSQSNQKPYQDAFNAYTNYVAGFNLGGNSPCSFNTICNWRLDSGNWSFEQGQQLLLRQYIKGGPATVPFDDSVIINAQTTPTLMQSITVWCGDVVNAIQTSNQNADASYVVEMLQHGTNAGAQNATITLSNGLTEFSYVTGDWQNNCVVAQITIGANSYPASVSPSVSNAATTNVIAPSGQTIVAFSGNTQMLQLAGGSTWVLSAINPVFG